MSLIIGTSEHHPCDMNLQKVDPTVVFRPRSPMIKSVKDGEEEAESSPLSYWRSSQFIRHGSQIKSLNFRDKIFSSLSRINLLRNKRFRNWEIL